MNPEFFESSKTPAEPIANIELEQHLLGFLLRQNEVFFQLPQDFQPEHFYENLHQMIFEKIKDLAASGEKFDPIVLKKHFPDVAPIQQNYLLKLGALFLLTNPIEAAKTLIDLANRRKILDLCENAMSLAKKLDTEETSGEITAWLTNQLQNLETYSRFQISSERQVSERLVKKLQENKALECSKTGIAKLDDAMDGGMFASKLYGIVGRKKMGKTMLSGSISHNLQTSGVKHLYLALEMGSDEIHQRSLARQVGCKEAVFRLGVSDTVLVRMAEYASSAKNYRLYLDAPSLKFEDLRHILPQYIRKYGIKGFILDCWQLVGGMRKGQSKADHLDDVAQWLAECVKKYKIWGLVTAQENQDENTRGGEGLRLACDQLYRLKKKEVESPEAWLEMMETRYTRWKDVGDDINPAIRIHDNGTHYESIGGIAA